MQNRPVIVTGSRRHTDKMLIERWLTALKPSCVIEGAAKGADTIANDWARANRVDFERFPAKWYEGPGHIGYNPNAGTERNLCMLAAWESQKPVVAAFPLPDSKGTLHCYRAAIREWSMPTFVITRLQVVSYFNSCTVIAQGSLAL